MDASKIYLWARYISEQDIFLSKIYFWAKYISEKNISMSKIYIEHKYESWLIVCYIWSHNMDAYALLYFGGHSGSTNLPAARIVLSHISLKSYQRNWIIPFRSHVLIKQPRSYADHLILMTFKFKRRKVVCIEYNYLKLLYYMSR